VTDEPRGSTQPATPEPIEDGSVPSQSVETEAPVRRGPFSRLVRRTVRILRLTTVSTMILLAAAIVSTIAIDLGPAVRLAAEKAGSTYLKRDLQIARLSIRLLTGRFLVEGLKIGGLEPGDRPFLTAKTIEVSMSFRALAHREILIDSVVMSDWSMLVETWQNGRHNFPRFTRDSRQEGPRRFVTTVKYVNARRGTFTFEDHGVPWSTVARNLDVTVAKTTGYFGEARFMNGTVAIQRYVPMRADLHAVFTLDGPLVRFSRIDLVADGSVSSVTGTVDLARWPEQTYRVRSRVDFPRMREVFFAREDWQITGEGQFAGTFHLFKGGRSLTGDFWSAEAGVNGLRFPDLRGSLVWLPDRLEVRNATSKLYGGTSAFSYSLMPLGQPSRPTLARFDASYRDVDVFVVSDVMALDGIRPVGRASGRNLLEWPLGRFALRKGEGRILVTPPDGTGVLGRRVPPERVADAGPAASGPFNPDPRVLGHVPIGGELAYRFDPAGLVIDEGHMATPSTFVSFSGRTAFGDDSEIPFHVTSADWQESDRVLAGIMTAFGSRTNAVPVGGYGEFDGIMRKSFRSPRIEGRFTGHRMRAWDVVWGRATGDLVIEDAYVMLGRAVVTEGDSELTVQGRFALGYPRRDGGEELNARFRVTRRDLADLRHAFALDDYPVDGRLSGEFHLYGKYQGPIGFGRMTLEPVVAYGEPLDSASASLRFEGEGVRLDGIEIAKAGGAITGAAYVGWDGTYSFNVDGRRIPVESVAALSFPSAPLSGTLELTASGSGQFEAPRYDARLKVFDLFVRDEGIGEITARLGVRNTVLTAELEAASPRLSVTGTGRIALTPEADGELTLRVTDASIDPYVRLFEPRLSPFTTAVASGSVRIAGELRNPARVLVDTTVDRLALRLFDYELRNDGPIRVSYDQETARLVRVRLVGDDTRLDVSGSLGVGRNEIALHTTGDANLGILQGFFRDLHGSGQAELAAEVTGRLDRPVLSGRATIAGGRVRHFALPHALEAINGRVAFDENGLRADGLTARLGGGLVRFGGRIALSGYMPTEYNLTASGAGMRLRYPEGFRSIVDADLSLTGPFEAPVLGGTVTVKSSVWSRRFEAAGNFFEFAGRATPVASAAATAGAFPLRFDVRVVAPSTLRIDNNLARIVSRADLSLRGTFDHPLVFGRAEIERGEVTFEGKRYVVTRGTIDFSNPSRIEPFFDVEAETRVRVPGETYRVVLTAAGTVDRFQWGLNSDPPLPTVDVLSLLLSDTAPADPELRALRSPSETEQQLLQARMAQLLVSPISSEVGRVVEQTFGVDTFQITPSLNDPAQQSSRLTPGARLTIGKRISNRVYLTFSQSLSSSSASRDQIILLEFDQSDRLSWLLSQNEDRTYALEMRVRRTF
jgi:TamB, inner membrane protein subunit of TAM complex